MQLLYCLNSCDCHTTCLLEQYVQSFTVLLTNKKNVTIWIRCLNRIVYKVSIDIVAFRASLFTKYLLILSRLERVCLQSIYWYCRVWSDFVYKKLFFYIKSDVTFDNFTPKSFVSVTENAYQFSTFGDLIVLCGPIYMCYIFTEHQSIQIENCLFDLFTDCQHCLQ